MPDIPIDLEELQRYAGCLGAVMDLYTDPSRPSVRQLEPHAERLLREAFPDADRERISLLVRKVLQDAIQQAHEQGLRINAPH